MEKIEPENPFKDLFAQQEQLAEFRVDSDRPGFRTGLTVRASYQGRWVQADVSQLDRPSLELYVKSRGDDWKRFALELLQYEQPSE